MKRFAAEDDIDAPERNVNSNGVVTAIGKALPRSEGEIAYLSTVRTADIRTARRDWKAKTLEKYAGLIEATLDEDQEDPDD